MRYAHTPGPWQIIDDAQHPANKRITSNIHPHIAKVYARSLEPDETTLGNAYLIKAAPLMLEVLINLRDNYAVGPSEWRSINQVITIATGGPNEDI